MHVFSKETMDAFFAEAGQRVVSDTAFRGDGMIWFTSVVPTDSRTCGAGLISWKWAVRMANGGSSTSPVFDHDGDGVVGSAGDHKTVLVDGRLVNVGVAAKQTSGGAATSPSFIGDRRFSCTTGGVGDCDDAVVPIAGSKQGRLSWAELQPRIEPTRPVLPDPRGLFPPQ